MNKEVIKPISDALVQRMNSPIIGGFVLSWVLVNHSLVIEFLFTSLEGKVFLAKTSTFDWLTDLVYPVFLTLVYLIVIPVIQLALDWAILKTLGEYRREHNAQVSRNIVVAATDHQSKLLEKELVSWENDRARLRQDIGELKRRKKESDIQYSAMALSLELMEEKCRIFQEGIVDAKESLEKPSMYLGSDQEDSRTLEEVCDEVIKILNKACDDAREL